jgi:hypothetical protein
MNDDLEKYREIKSSRKPNCLYNILYRLNSTPKHWQEYFVKFVCKGQGKNE